MHGGDLDTYYKEFCYFKLCVDFKMLMLSLHYFACFYFGAISLLVLLYLMELVISAFLWCINIFFKETMFILKF